MKQEIELKILDIDKDAVECRLRELGAKRIFSDTVKTIFFDFPDKRIRKTKRIVRVRQEGKGRVAITLKGPRRIEHGMKVASEEEISVRSFGEARRLLQSKGLHSVVYFEKKRTSYLIGRVRIDIDEYPHIPPFLEIEARTKKEIVDTVLKLHLQKHKSVALGIRELLQKFYPQLRLDDLHF